MGKQADYELRQLSGDCEITMRKILGLNPDLDVAVVLIYDGESRGQQSTLQDLLRHGAEGQTNTETQGRVVYQNPAAMRQAIGGHGGLFEGATRSATTSFRTW